MGHLLLFLAGVLDRRHRLLAGRRSRAWSTPGGEPGAGAVALLLLVLVRDRPAAADPNLDASPGGWSASGRSRSAMLAAAAGYQLDPEHFQTYLAAWLGFTGFHCVAGALVRRSGWWRPADEYSRNLRWPTFAVGVVVLSGLAYALLRGSGSPSRRRGGGGRCLLIFVVAWVGFWARRRRFTATGVGGLMRREDRVRPAQPPLAPGRTVLVPAVQAVVIGIGLHQLAGSVAALAVLGRAGGTGPGRRGGDGRLGGVGGAHRAVARCRPGSVRAAGQGGTPGPGAWRPESSTTVHPAAARRTRAADRVGRRTHCSSGRRAAPGDLHRRQLPGVGGLAAAADRPGLRRLRHRSARRAAGRGLSDQSLVGARRRWPPPSCCWPSG